jgi:hypothetical protein
MQRPRAFRWVVIGGAVAAAADIVFAFAFYGARGVSPERILQSIASGLLGRAAYEGGAATALLGLGLHGAIAIAAALVFCAAAARVPWLLRHPAWAALGFGVGMYAAMNLVVVPLSAFPHPQRFPPDVLLPALAIHVLGVGLPIVLCVRRAFAGAFTSASALAA